MTTRELSPSSPGRRRILVLADHLGRHLSDMLTYVIRRKAEVMVIFKPYAPMAAVTQDIDALTRSFSRHDAVVVIAGTNDLQLNSSEQIVPLVESILRHVLHRTRLIVATIPKRYDSSSYKKTISQANKGIRSLRSRYPALKILELEDMGRAYHCSRGFSLNTKGKLKLCVKLSELVAVTPKTKFLNAPFDRIAMFLDPFEPADDESYLQPFVSKQENFQNFPVNRVVIESEIKFMSTEGAGDESGEDLRDILGSVIGEIILSQGSDLQDQKSPILLSVVKNKLNKNIGDVSVIKKQKITVSNAEKKKYTSSIREDESANDYSQASTQTTVHIDDDKVLQLVYTIKDSDLAFNVTKTPAVIDIVLDLKRVLKFCNERNMDCTLVCSDIRMNYDRGHSEISISLKLSVTLFSSDSGCGDHLRFDLKPTTKFSRTEIHGLESGDHNILDGSEMILRNKVLTDEDDPDFFDLSIMNWNALLDISDDESFFSASNSEDSILVSHDGQRLDLHSLLKASSKYYSRSHTDWNELLNNDFGKMNNLQLANHQNTDVSEYRTHISDTNTIFSPPERKNKYNHSNFEIINQCKLKIGNSRIDCGRKRNDRSSSHHSFSSNLNALCTRLLKSHYWANSLNKKFCSVSEECNLNFKNHRNSNSSIFDEVRKFRKLEGEYLRNRQIAKKYDFTLVKETFCNGSFDYLWGKNKYSLSGPTYLREVRSNQYSQRLIDNTLWEMMRSVSRSSKEYLSSVDNVTKMGSRENGSNWYGADKRFLEADGRSRVLDHKEVTTTARNSRARNYIVRTVRKLLSKLIHLPGNIDSD